MMTSAKTRPLGDLLDGLSGDAAVVRIGGLAYDSRRVKPGDLFFALPGVHADGASFARDAVRRGASAVVAEHAVDLAIPVVVVPRARRAMAIAAGRFWNHPDHDVRLSAVIGTNGKSTVAAGLRTIFETAGIPAGLLGTVDYRWGTQVRRASRTTPEAPDFYEMIAAMRDEGIQAAAAEVSSHAIVLDRVWGVRFRCGIFTNITRDHLDYHKTFEEYRRVKASFFEHLDADSASAVINMDDPSFGAVLAAARRTRICRYSVRNVDADLFLQPDQHSLKGTEGRITVENRTIRFRSPLWGAFSHSNIAAMAAAAHVQGISDKDISDGIAAFAGISGRIERVPASAPFDVFVDYAHTPDALNAVLSAARPLVRGRLLVLFGCGGDRDKGKRPEMAQAVERWADRIYLTSDNPRSEDPNSIIADVTVGFSKGSQVWSDPDRVRAIERSIGDAQPGDAVFLCGKGHEDTQEIAGVFHHFSDRETAAQILAARGHAPQTPRGGGILPGSAVGPGGDPSPTRS